MKKITLIAAVAALTASSAIAAAPQQVTAAKATKAVAELKQVSGMGMLKDNLRITNRIEATAEGDDQVTIDVEASYAPAESAFYLGWSPETYGYSDMTQAFTGIRGEIGFRNLTQGADAFSWSTGRITGLTADQSDYTYEYTTSTDVNFFMKLTPRDRYSFPTLSAFVGEDEYSYVPTAHTYYHCGGSAAAWGWDLLADGETEITDYNQVFGVSPCSAIPGATLFPEYAISRPDASNYDSEANDANGTPMNWYAYSSEQEVVTDIKIKAFGTYIPPMTSPYMLNAMWAWINTVEATTAVTLPIKVYTINEDGAVEFENLLGEGEINFPEGTTAMSDLQAMPIVEFTAVDADGYAIDAPICVAAGQGIMVCIEGLDNENLLRFDMVANDNCLYPIEKREIANYLFPNHAYTFVDCTVTPAGGEAQEISTMLTAPYSYYADDTRTSLIDCCDFTMFFDINFPVVMNVDETSADVNTANFNVTLPAEGGEVVVPVYCDYIIDTLISEGMVTTSADEWITFSQAFDEEQQITNVTISAEALPEGETGRTGAVKYEGFALDFTINVIQGEGAGIDGIVVTPAAKGTKFFDMQGRQLQAAPAAGMYIESVDGKATKRLAR